MPDRQTSGLLSKAVCLCLFRVGSHPNQEISLLLTDDAEITRYNRRYRGLDQATDVLSFSMDRSKPRCPDPAGGRTLLGDIIISLERVADQALTYGHSYERELVFLTVHGMLHLLGLDHENKSGRIRIENYQKQILKALRLGR